MAQLDKLRRVLHNRYTPFFLPVIASLAYIGFVVLVIPENLQQSSTTLSDEDSESPETAPANSGSTAQDLATRAAKRRARLTNRAFKKVTGGLGAVDAPAGAAQPPQGPAVPPAPMPASPDGAE
jgi:hypothetical protein